MPPEKLKYLKLLAEKYSAPEELYTEIARISAQLSLPKGTEHFMSDIHGEYEAFCHIINNCSGVIREKVDQWLSLPQAEADALCTLIYYPDVILRHMHLDGEISADWYRIQVERLALLARLLSSKYTRDKVRRVMPAGWEFLLDELMHYQSDEEGNLSEQEDNRRRYHNAILDTVIATQSVDGLIIALSQVIKHLAVDRLHVVGDVFDRGPRADSIMDILASHHSVDIEWGNHDILWMGAAAGSDVCIAGVVRNSLAYSNMDVLEKGYAIPLRSLALFAERMYPDLPNNQAALHAITVMLFKLEGQLIDRNPEFGMEDRKLLHLIDPDRHTVQIGEKTYSIKELPFPTVSKEAPYELSPEEKEILRELHNSFRHSQRLQDHISFLYRRGWMYRAFNGNLLYHGCVPMNEDGSFRKRIIEGVSYQGKAYMDEADRLARRAYYQRDQYALDFMWYLWCGEDSPVCGRNIKTFARSFIPDEETWKEPRNPYYQLYNSESVCRMILKEFGLEGEESRIINGHTPIRVSHGESPLKAGGKLVVIDGGFCRAYQKTTGIAGYTLIANSHGMRLMSHQPFTTLKDAQRTGRDIHSQSVEFVRWPHRQYVRDTDHGKEMQQRMEDLIALLGAIRDGQIVI